MLGSLKTGAAARLPRLFALASIPADWLAASNPASELNLLPLLVGRGDFACDIGANRGLFTYWLLRLGVRVAAFEPNPEMVRVLGYRFRRAVAAGRLTLSACALSDGDGEAVLHIPHNQAALATLDGGLAHDGGVTQDVAVPRRRLDDCLDGPVDFIKLDVEGHEARVLEGAQRVLATSRPTLLVEAEERHRAGALASVRALLAPHGYAGFFAQADGMHPVETFDPSVHQRLDALNEDGSGARAPYVYVNNFVFTVRPEVNARLAGWRPGRTLLRG